MTAHHILVLFTLIVQLAMCSNFTNSHHERENFRNVGGELQQRNIHRALSLLRSGRCKHIYFDFGSNIGIQIRKLYQPDAYPHAPVLPIFSKYFGDVNRKEVCAFGFEANPSWTVPLKLIDDEYNAAGYPVVIFTETAVGVSNGNISYFQEPDTHDAHHEWGASLYKFKQTMKEFTTGVMDVAAFINGPIAHRHGITPESKIVAKCDVESYEFILLPKLITTTAICHLDYMSIELHDHIIEKDKPKGTDFLSSVKWILAHTTNCGVELTGLDDETYGDGKEVIPFPPKIAVQNLRH